MDWKFAARAMFAGLAMTFVSQPIVALPTPLLTKATALSYIPVDESWRTARSALRSVSDQAEIAQISADILKTSPDERVMRVNEWVNSIITFVDDSERLNVADHWATPRETLAAKKGDCEDYAVLKMELLHAAGIPLEAMQIVIIEERNFKYHAMLMVELGGSVTILDNRTDDLKQIGSVMKTARFALGVDGQFKLDQGRRISQIRGGSSELLGESPIFIVTSG